MTLRVTIQTTDHKGGTYPVFYTLDDGVSVGPVGELTLVSVRQCVALGGHPLEFRVYAPGTWREVNVEHTKD